MPTDLPNRAGHGTSRHLRRRSAIHLGREGLPLSNIERGAKHTCPLCGTKFYDLQQQPPSCPRCRADTAESMRHSGLEQITKRWMDAILIIADGEQANSYDDARLLIDAVNREWRRRQEDEAFFEWPTTDAQPGLGPFSIDPPEKGMLSCLGYKVGKNGKTRGVRRHILLEVFGGELPPVNSRSYVEEWCRPNSAGRLQKLAEAIAAFARNAKRRNDNSMRHAIRHWEYDLNFLYQELYVNRFQFAWPSVEQ